MPSADTAWEAFLAEPFAEGRELLITRPVVTNPAILRRIEPRVDLIRAPIRVRPELFRPIRPIRFIGPLVAVPVPTFAAAVPAGAFTLWPVVADATAYYLLAQPALTSFQLTVRKETRPEGQVMTGGTAVVGVTAYPADTPAAATSGEWAAALEAAGHGRPNWRFLPLPLRGLVGAVQVSTEESIRPATVSADDATGSATAVVELSALGATAWEQAIQARNPAAITAVVSLEAGYVTRTAADVGKQSARLSAPLGVIAGGVGPDSVTQVQSATTLDAKIVVTPNEYVDAVVIDARPNQGIPPRNEVFDRTGGTLTLRMTSDDLGGLAVDWSAEVRYRGNGWPTVRQFGRLSVADNQWASMVKPDSWLHVTTVFAVLLDAAGNPAGPAVLRPDVDRVAVEVSGWVDEQGPAGGTPPLVSVTELHHQQFTTVVFPRTPSRATPPRKVSVVTTRPGGVGMLTRTLGAAETVVVIKVKPDGKAEMVTNSDPVSEADWVTSYLSL